jgi:hypothetical protein
MEREEARNMIEEETKGTLDFCALRDAIERRDAEVLSGFYAEDSELRVVYAVLPEGPTFELSGRAQIERYLRAVCEQEMFCLVEGGAVVGEAIVRFREICFYPDGGSICVRTTLELMGGLIARQTDVVERARNDGRRDEGSER